MYPFSVFTRAAIGRAVFFILLFNVGCNTMLGSYHSVDDDDGLFEEESTVDTDVDININVDDKISDPSESNDSDIATDGDSDSDSNIDADDVSDSDENTDDGPDTEPFFDSDLDTDSLDATNSDTVAEFDTEIDSETATDSDTKIDSEAATDGDTQMDSEAATDIDIINDSEAATDVEIQTDDTETSETNTEMPTETDSETEPVDPLLRLCLSPGHPSSEGDNPYEAIINRKVAFYLEDLLTDAGYDVLIAVDDISEEEIFESGFDNEGNYEQSLLVPVSLDDRVDICNEFDADYFISLHHNAFSDSSVNYAMTLYAEKSEDVPYSEDTVEWAELTTEHLIDTMNVTGGYTRGDRSFLGYGLGVLQGTTMPAILTEASFVTNPDERSRLNQNDYLKGEAGAIFDGFVDFRQMFDGEK